MPATSQEELWKAYLGEHGGGGGVSYYVEANKKTRASGLSLFTAKSGLPNHRG